MNIPVLFSLPEIGDGEDKSSPLKNKIRKNYRHVRKWAKRTQTNCFRIYDKEIKEYPLAIDYYGGSFCIHYFPGSRAEEEPRADLVAAAEDALKDLFQAGPDNIFWRTRIRRQMTQQYEKAGTQGRFFTVYEYGVKFLVNLEDYLDTGLFLDHRETRQLVAQAAVGKRLLNLFAYTCSFSVHAAIFDPFGNAVHTTLSFPLTGEQVLITGAGPIGIMAAAIASKGGANEIVITDISDYRLGLARRMGATHAVNIATQSLPEVMKQAGIEYGFTVGLEMSGHPQALTDQLTYARHGAHIALLGILPPGCAIDWDLVIFKMLEIKGIYGREMFRTWHQMIHLLASGLDLSPIVTHRFSLDEYEKGFEAMFAGQCGKVVLSL